MDTSFCADVRFSARLMMFTLSRPADVSAMRIGSELRGSQRSPTGSTNHGSSNGVEGLKSINDPRAFPWTFLWLDVDSPRPRTGYLVGIPLRDWALEFLPQHGTSTFF